MLLWLTCTHGRFTCLQRNLKCYLDQDYRGQSVMFICNSGKPLKLPDDFVLPAHKQIYIDNCSLMNFQSVGQKYQHAVEMAMRLYPDIRCINSADDDDIFLPDHLSEGNRGYIQGRLKGNEAYKPQQSYYRYRDTEGRVIVTKAENTLEPSIFISAKWVQQKGYAPVPGQVSPAMAGPSCRTE